jgi:hypothetical protein
MQYRKLLVAFLALSLTSAVAVAEEEAPPPKKPEKPPAEDAMGTILQLPLVIKWKENMESRGNHLVAWGESIKSVGDLKCWDIAVGEAHGDEDAHIWRRFCVTLGNNVLVEGTQVDPMDEITYYKYDDWLSKCKPTDNSSGSC